MNSEILKGRVFKLGDNISTDLLMPSFSMYGKVPEDEKKNYVLYEQDPQFVKKIKPGDILIGGKNFGCGSSRPATKNLIDLGLSCVIAESFSAIFFRNSIAMGFPLFKSSEAHKIIEEKEIIEVFPEKGYIQPNSSDSKIAIEPYPDFLMKIVDSGGLMPLFRKDQSIQQLS